MCNIVQYSLHYNTYGYSIAAHTTILMMYINIWFLSNWALEAVWDC